MCICCKRNPTFQNIPFNLVIVQSSNNYKKSQRWNSSIFLSLNFFIVAVIIQSMIFIILKVNIIKLCHFAWDLKQFVPSQILKFPLVLLLYLLVSKSNFLVTTTLNFQFWNVNFFYAIQYSNVTTNLCL